MLSRATSRSRAARVALAALAGWLGLALAPDARAVPQTFYFFADTGGLGVDPALAAASGIPILAPDFVGQATDVLVPTPSLDLFDPFPPTLASGNRAFSDWFVTNVSSFDLASAFLTFESETDFVVGSTPVSYTDGKVGLEIDPDLGWRFVRDGSLVFPAIDLGRLGPGAVSDVFQIRYVVDETMRRVGNTYYTPKLRFGMAVVPEPGTAALLAGGLALLAAARRRDGGRAPR